jgi:hypothetical protein
MIGDFVSSGKNLFDDFLVAFGAPFLNKERRGNTVSIENSSNSDLRPELTHRNSLRVIRKFGIAS